MTRRRRWRRRSIFAIGLFVTAAVWVLWVFTIPFTASPEALEWLHSDLNGVDPPPQVMLNPEAMGAWLETFERTAQAMREFAGVEPGDERRLPISELAPLAFASGVDQDWENTEFIRRLPEISRRTDWRAELTRPGTPLSGWPEALDALHLHARLALFRGQDSFARELFGAAASHALLDARYSRSWSGRWVAQHALGVLADPDLVAEVDGNPAGADLWRSVLRERYREVGGSVPAVEGLLQLAIREQWQMIDEAPDELGFRKGVTKARMLEEALSIVEILRSEGIAAAYESSVDGDSLLGILGGWLFANPIGQQWQARCDIWHLFLLEGAGLEMWLGDGSIVQLRSESDGHMVRLCTWARLLEKGQR